MSAVSPPTLPSARWLRVLRQPPSRRAEIAGWILVAALLVGMRVWVALALPSYVWTRDSGSYVAPALGWLETGHWITNPRRGPIYSLFLAWVFKAGGSLETVATLQAVIGAGVAALTIALLRFWLGRRAGWPLLFCSLVYALYSMPVELERLIRNETLLALFTTVAFGAWRLTLGGIKDEEDTPEGSAAWSAAGGLAAGLMQLLKGIFPIYPLIVAACIGWNWRRRPKRAAVLLGCFLLPFVLPTAASKLYNKISGTGRPAEPEAGEMFYGRTAQWTVLDPGSLAPDIKERIRGQAQAYMDRYQRTGKLENNEIVKRTVVPTLKCIIVDERGGTLAEVDRFCWQLGFEAVRRHPFAYLRQAGHDLFTLNFITAQRMVPFRDRTLTDSFRDARAYCLAHHSGDDPARPAGVLAARVFNLDHAGASIQRAAAKHSQLAHYSHFSVALGRVRLLSPVFLTTVLLPLLWWVSRGRTRLFWLSLAVLWYYYLVLLATVGRPLDRYLLPVVPIMFWTVGSAAFLGWERLLAFLSRREVGVSPGGAGMGEGTARAAHVSGCGERPGA